MLQCGTNLRKYWIPAFARKTTSKKRGYDKYCPRRTRPPPQSRHPRATPVILALPPSSPRYPRHPRVTRVIPALPASSPRYLRHPRERGDPCFSAAPTFENTGSPHSRGRRPAKKRGYDKHSPRRTRPPPQSTQSRHLRAAVIHALPALPTSPTRRPRHPRERGDPCSSVSPTFENTGSPHSRGRRPAKKRGYDKYCHQ